MIGVDALVLKPEITNAMVEIEGAMVVLVNQMQMLQFAFDATNRDITRMFVLLETNERLL
jgi:hypothetical protein